MRSDELIQELRHLTEKLDTQDHLAAIRERTLLVALDSVQDAIVVRDRDCRLIACNRKHAEMNRSTIQEIIGKTPEEYLPEWIAQSVRRECEMVMETGTTLAAEDDGSQESRTFFVSRTPATASSGDVVGCITLVRDMTEVVAVRKRLSEQRRFFVTVLDSIPALVSYVDTEHVYRYANASYRKWFGVDPVDKPLADVLGEDAYRVILPRVERALAGSLVEYEDEVPYSTGVANILATYTPHIEDGKPLGFVAMVTQIVT